jgi:hypothetical protein
MTDRHAAYIVVLHRDIREDDAEQIIEALKMIKFVASVEPVTASLDQQVAIGRRDLQWVEALGRLARGGPQGSTT